MKKRGLVAMLCFLLLMGVGCRDVVPPLPETPGEALAVPTEQPPEILAPVVPGRDPFSVAAPAARQKKTGTVDRTGRDPFLPGPPEPEPIVPEPVPPEPASPEPVPPEPVPEPALPEPVPEPVPPAPTEEERLSEGLVIALQTVDRSWLDVFVDGRRVLRSNVAAGQTLRWEAEREIVLQQVGREHAVRLTVNGKDFGLLSQFAQRLAAGEDLEREAGVRISFERRHLGGVLVGLRFSTIVSQ